MILSPPVSGGMLWYGLVQPRLAAKPVPVQPAAAPAPRKLLSEICVSCQLLGPSCNNHQQLSLKLGCCSPNLHPAFGCCCIEQVAHGG